MGYGRGERGYYHDGTSNVATTNSYVIIHRMKCCTWGTSGPNVGNIKATAVTNATVTAQILAGEGQTQMAIYGVPRGQTLYMCDYYASIVKGASSVGVALKLLVNTYADNQLTGFLTKHTVGATTEGTNYIRHEFGVPSGYAGPCIVKLQANASANNTNVDGGFSGILVTE